MSLGYGVFITVLTGRISYEIPSPVLSAISKMKSSSISSFGKELPPIIGQTQTRIEKSYADSDDEDILITESSEGHQFDEISK